MKYKKAAAFLMAVIFSMVVSYNSLAIELPDPGELASDIISGVSETAEQVSDFVSGFSEEAGEVLAQWGDTAGETADHVKAAIDEAGASIQVSAEELGTATAEKAAELTEKVQKTAGDAIDAVAGAADLVIDKAGHVIDLAAAGAGHVADAARDAMEILKEKGDVLVEIAEAAIADIDLSDEANWETAREAVFKAIALAYKTKVISEKALPRETLDIIANIVFDSVMYGYQYSNGDITLGEYAWKMSEIIIREGLPTGVGFIAKLLPIPGAEYLATEVTTYLVTLAYGDKSGEEIEAEEEKLLKEAASVMAEEAEMTEETDGPDADAAFLNEIMNPEIPEIRENVTHIACVGDSITFGFGVWLTEMSKENTYPACLERMLGDGYQTLNYGVSGKTLLREGDDPYISHYMYNESIHAVSEIYIIMLGTNDSKPFNWNTGDFRSELKDFVQTYIDLASRPAVYLATPPRVFGEGDEVYDTSNETIENEIVPIVREVAEETGVTLIDMYEETKDHPEWFVDGVHPGAAGNEEFAKIFASCLVEKE